MSQTCELTVDMGRNGQVVAVGSYDRCGLQGGTVQSRCVRFTGHQGAHTLRPFHVFIIDPGTICRPVWASLGLIYFI
jgi:hypothetical protein